jgi:hypothetical protein
MIVAHENGRISFTFTSSGKKFISDELGAVPGQWLFIGISFGKGMIRFYKGGRMQAVALCGTHATGDAKIGKEKYGGNLWLGNLQDYQTGKLPFVGLMDEVRIFSAKAGDDAHALSSDEIEAVRRFDLNPLLFKTDVPAEAQRRRGAEKRFRRGTTEHGLGFLRVQ